MNWLAKIIDAAIWLLAVFVIVCAVAFLAATIAGCDPERCSDGDMQCDGDVLQVCKLGSWTPAQDCTATPSKFSGWTCCEFDSLAACQLRVVCELQRQYCEGLSKLQKECEQ